MRSILRALQVELGESQSTFGRRCGISASAVAELEEREASGTLTLAALRQHVAACGYTLVCEVLPSPSALAERYEPRRELRVQRSLHVALADKLLHLESEAWRELGLAHLARRHPWSYRHRWAALLRGPRSGVIDACTRWDEHGDDLRQEAPLFGLLTEDERLAAIYSGARAGTEQIAKDCAEALEQEGWVMTEPEPLTPQQAAAIGRALAANDEPWHLVPILKRLATSFPDVDWPPLVVDEHFDLVAFLAGPRDPNGP